ncbi:MAG: NEW3 domain-containing protein [Dehalococcoidia bacterium]
MALTIITVLMSVMAESIRADVGVAIDIGRITVDQTLSKGGSYQLPSIGVRNPGTEHSTYRMAVSSLQSQPEREPPSDWFTFSPESFALEPGAAQPVRVTLEIPTDAEPGDYAALIQAQIAPSGEGAQVGAAAASQLTFTVEPSTILEAWLVRGRRQMDAWSPWSYLLPIAAISTVAVGWLRHRYHFGFRVERRP